MMRKPGDLPCGGTIRSRVKLTVRFAEALPTRYVCALGLLVRSVIFLRRCDMENGNYTADVSLTGGSGKAAVKSPTELTVTDGGMTAVIEWNSPNYDYMELGGKEYYPVNDDGNSRFVIDVAALDADIPVRAETVAMSEPHMIDYTLRFTSPVIAGNAPMWGVYVAGAAVLAALCVIFAVRRKRK